MSGGEITLVVIGCLWAAWLAYWLAMAFSTKRTLERAGILGYRLVGGAIVVALLLAGRAAGVAWDTRLWRTPLALGIASDVIVLAGAAFAVWARVTLGRNWSAEVTFKQDHELIEAGPYARARHPIYTGMLTMALGTAIDYGRWSGFGILLALCGAFWWKAREEERVMSEHFPDAYAEYRRRVPALIPFASRRSRPGSRQPPSA